MPRKFDLTQGTINSYRPGISRDFHRILKGGRYTYRVCVCVCNVIQEYQLNTSTYLSFPMYLLLDLDMLSASIEIIYSVHVVLLVLFADKRNFPFSTSSATEKQC